MRTWSITASSVAMISAALAFAWVSTIGSNPHKLPPLGFSLPMTVAAR